MFRAIYFYELKGLLRKPSTTGFFVAFFLIALVSMLGTGGYFDGLPASDKPQPLLNAPYEINFILQYFNKFFLFLLPAIIGATIYKDFQSRTFHILYAYPISRLEYLAGKFFSSLTVVFLICLSAGLAFACGEWMLGADNPYIGPFRLSGYLSAYLFFTFPNMLIYGLLVFIVVGHFRNIYAGFIGVIILFFLQIITENLFTGSPFLIALTDPFAQNAVAYETHLWTLSQRNSQQIPLLGVVLFNRLFWLAIALTAFGLFYKKFSFSHQPSRFFPPLFGKKDKAGRTEEESPAMKIGVSAIRYDFSNWQQLRITLRLAIFDLRYILKNWMFLLLTAFGILAIVFALGRVTNTGDFTLLPLTRIMLSIPMFFFSSVIVLITFVFSGMLVHRAATARSNQLIDTTAVSNSTLLGSKLLAVLLLQCLLLLVMMLCGIALQIYNGYYDFEIGLYLYHLFLLTFPTLIIWAIVSMTVHTLFPNLYLSIFLLLLAWIGKDQFHQLGIDSYLLTFNAPPQMIYSDLNGFGNDLAGHHLVNAYWLSFSGLALLLAFLLWKRGLNFSIKERIRMALRRFRGVVPLFAVVCLLLLFIFGFRIYQEENSGGGSSGNDKQLLSAFEAQYGQYKNTLQPSITSVNLQIDLFPETHAFTAEGSYVLTNRSSGPVDTLLVKTGYDEQTTFSLDRPHQLISRDSNMQFSVLRLDRPLSIGDSLRLQFEIRSRPNTLFQRASTVLGNGTFLRTDILPRLGYFLDKEGKHPGDSLASAVNFYSMDAGFVDLQTIISTSADQTAIAPGYLQRSWKEGGRNYFHYQTDQPVKLAFAFNSGSFDLTREDYQGVALEVYHHPDHDHHITKMLDGLKAAIDYNTRYFSDYQHREARIIEFPLSEGSYATTMANSIPMSEQRFVIHSGRETRQVDLSFYVPAHELTHQWWGNQLIPADALGARMLTESITEYISLRLYEQYFGAVKARHFLQLQRRRYLRGRTREREEEQPLYLVRSAQDYISYGKGAIAFNTLKHYLGEEELNAMLKEFFTTFQYDQQHYPTTVDLLTVLRKRIPAEWQYLITDLFETITFYDNKLNDVRISPAGGGTYEIAVDFEIRKYQEAEADTALPLNDFIELGFFDQEEELFFVKKVKVTALKNKETIRLDQRPVRVMIDPNFLLIDKDVDDNEREI